MIIYYKDIGLEVIATSIPKIRSKCGCRWKYLRKNINGVSRYFHFVSNWGRYFYFNFNGIWYKLAMYPDNLPIDYSIYHCRNFYVNDSSEVMKFIQEEDKRCLLFENGVYAWNCLNSIADLSKLSVYQINELYKIAAVRCKLNSDYCYENIYDFRRDLLNLSDRNRKVITRMPLQNIDEIGVEDRAIYINGALYHRYSKIVTIKRGKNKKVNKWSNIDY